jgi:hypothetical protein
MLKELEPVALTRDVAESGLKSGDVGAIVHVYSDHSIYEVEFVAANGKTVALLTLTERDIRPISGREILHVRELEKTA